MFYFNEPMQPSHILQAATSIPGLVPLITYMMQRERSIQVIVHGTLALALLLCQYKHCSQFMILVE
jgi:hypothetical protein